MVRLACLVVALCAASAGAAVWASEEVEPSITVSGMAEATDGDGLVMGPILIRLHGIDSPESGQKCSRAGGGTWSCDEAALDHLASLVDGERVACRALERDPYGRLISRCHAGDVDLSEALVREGLAWAFTRYSYDYVGAEAEALAARRGIWQEDTQAPWDYREDRWARAAAASPREGCPIKGNISASGEGIYHTPWSRFYDRTKIDVSAGERWFCDEAEAVQAGWRPPRSR